MRVNRKRPFFILLLLVISLGLFCWAAWSALGPSMPAPNISLKTQKTPNKKAERVEKDALVTPPAPARKAPERVPASGYESGSTLGQLTTMRGKKYLLEQQIRIEELEKKLDELKAPAKEEPKLELPPVKPEMIAPPPPQKKPVVVVSLQGVGGQLSATIQTEEGKLVTVRNGGSFGGGIVQITRQGVSIRRKNGTVSPLPFE